ncbi:carboxymuconolactone decarboxylase [Campylobacter sp. MIT 99-7217]|nr:carboxymuconolactone decarboxylase [Campylobacter sp. MIT 99-7217]
MNLTKIAKENFERLFGKQTPPLAKTDPEFFERYVNFAFDESLKFSSKLEEKQRLMLVLGALIASGGLSEFKIMLKASLNAGVKPEEVQEILYQSTPYVGMGKALEFILASNEIFKELKIALPLAPRANTTLENRQEKGLEIQRKFFGSAIDKGNAAAPNDEKHIRAFLSAHCFGDFYTRGGLELKFRELLTFVFVSALGGADAQVKAHVAGNLNIGNDRSILLATITTLIPYIGYPRSLNALAALNELSKAKA